MENDEFCRRILAKHWPNIRRHGDIRTFRGREYERPDVICGGFPCKQTSTAAAIHGRRSGLKGNDSGLWWQMCRLVAEVKPKIVVVENVAGASTWGDEIEAGLARAGYHVWRLHLTAEEFGAYHSRRRLFFVADVDGERLSRTWQERSPEVERSERRAAAGNAWSINSIEFRRMADGFSTVVDRNRRQRIERLGNAVVPQVAAWIGRRIIEAVG